MPQRQPMQKVLEPMVVVPMGVVLMGVGRGEEAVLSADPGWQDVGQRPPLRQNHRGRRGRWQPMYFDPLCCPNLEVGSENEYIKIAVLLYLVTCENHTL